MKNGIRIFLVCSFLVGGTAFFALWSLNQYNKTLGVLNASYTAIANIPQIPLSKTTTETEQAPTPPPEITVTPAASTDLKPSFVFPKIDKEVYIGCTYRISFQSSTAMGSLRTSLVDAGAREIVEPFKSGLARENKIESNSQSLHWEVGAVWPGDYYIKVTDANGVVVRSDVFTIKKMSDDLSTGEREKICKESDSSL